MSDSTLSNMIVGASINAVILWVLMQYDERIAWYYLLLLFAGSLFLYHQQIFASINMLIGYAKGSLS